MDRNQYLRRAFALEQRAPDFTYPGLRAAFLNTAAQYRNRANQTVVGKTDAKLEGVQRKLRFGLGSDQHSAG
jgi:hypothetical protein